MGAIWTACTEAFSAMLGLIGEFLSALTNGSLSPLLGLFAVGICISLIMVCVKICRKITWGA